jgi:hypothetical protein
MSGRLVPLAALIFGLATLAAFLWLGAAPEVTALYSRSEVALVVSEFQRSVTTQDLARVFYSPADPAIVAAMDVLNTRDLYAFIPAYALFLIAAAIMIGGARHPVTWIAVAFGVLGAAMDVVETIIQLRITADFANADQHLPVATWHWLKYSALALNGLVIAALCLLAPTKRWIVGVAAFLPLPLVLLAWAGITEPRLFSVAFILYWVALLALAAIETARGRGAAA